MSIAYSIVKHGVAGNLRVNVVDITLDGSYAANGYAITAASLGVGTIHMVVPTMKTTEGVRPSYDYTANKLKMFKGASTVTVTSGNADYKELATNDTLISSSSIVRCLVVGDAATG